MSSFAQPQKSHQETRAAATARPGSSTSGPVEARAIRRLQRASGNHAVRRLVQADAGQEDGSSPTPLPADLARKWRHLVPFDLAAVRVHQGAGPDEAARRAGTLAYSAGRDIVLSSRARGDEMVLAHEVAHVAQQRAAVAGRAVPRVRDAALEQDAAAGAGRLLRGEPLGTTAVAPVGAYGFDRGAQEYDPGDLAYLKQLLERPRLLNVGQASLAFKFLRRLSDRELHAIARHWGDDLSLTLARSLTSAEWLEIAPRLEPYVSSEARIAAGSPQVPVEPEPAGDEAGGPIRYEVASYLAEGMADLETAQVLAQSSGRFTLIVERETRFDVALLRTPAGTAPGTLTQIAAHPEADVIHPPGARPAMLVTADGWRLYYRSAWESDGESQAGRWFMDVRDPGAAVLPGLGRAALVARDPMRVLDTGLREFVLGRLAVAEVGAMETQSRIGSGLEGVSVEELDTIRLTAATLAALNRQIGAEREVASKPIPMMYPTPDTLAMGRHLHEEKRQASARLRVLQEERAATLSQYPMLARIPDAELEAFTALEDDRQLATLAATIPSVLESIRKLRAGLIDGSLDLWDYPEIVEAGLEAMGIEDQGLREAAVARYRSERRKELAVDLGLALLGLVLGLGAAFASGGVALALAGGALAVDVGDALRQTARADLQLALANANVDPTEALVPGDLTGPGVTVWLAWAGVVLDTVQLVQVARLVERGMAIGEATRLIAHAEGLDPTGLRRLWEQASTTFKAVGDPKIVELASLLRVPISLRDDLPRGVWVTFATDALGGVKDIAVVLGQGTTRLDLLGHVATVQRLQEWVGTAGWVRAAWARVRGKARAGQLRFEAVLEIEKLDAMVHVRRVLLEKQPLAPGTAQALERDIEVLAGQRERFADLVEEAREGRGVVAASFDEEELGRLMNEMFERELKRVDEPPPPPARWSRPGTEEAPAPFDERRLGGILSGMFEEAMRAEVLESGSRRGFYLVDWQKYVYVRRHLGIVETPQGRQAWYIRTGGGGAAFEGEPAAGDPARIYGFAHVQHLDPRGEDIPGSTRKWFIKPGEGRMGVGNEEVSAWLRDLVRVGALPELGYRADVVPRPFDPSNVADIAETQCVAQTERHHTGRGPRDRRDHLPGEPDEAQVHPRTGRALGDSRIRKDTPLLRARRHHH